MKPKDWTIVIYNFDEKKLLRKETLSSEQIRSYDRSGKTDGFDHFVGHFHNAGYSLVDWNIWVYPKILIFREQ